MDSVSGAAAGMRMFGVDQRRQFVGHSLVQKPFCVGRVIRIGNEPIARIISEF